MPLHMTSVNSTGEHKPVSHVNNLNPLSKICLQRHLFMLSPAKKVWLRRCKTTFEKGFIVLLLSSVHSRRNMEASSANQ